MGKSPVSFRLSEEAMTVIQKIQSSLAADQHTDVDRTEALEHILRAFDRAENKPIARLKKLFTKTAQEQGTRPLESFLTA